MLPLLLPLAGFVRYQNSATLQLGAHGVGYLATSARLCVSEMPFQQLIQGRISGHRVIPVPRGIEV
jgi:hypothetical protein